ncbi:[FeFe] hydrogenase, group A [Pseudomonadota bacterium]
MGDKLIKLFINNKEIAAKEGDTLLKVALNNGFDIPYYCYHPDLPIDGNCRACLIEVVDEKRGNWITTSCNLQIKEGMKILLETEEVKKLRKQTLEMLFGGHMDNCDIYRSHYCRIHSEIFKKYGIDNKKYDRDQDIHQKFHKMNVAVELDPSICINCTRCIRVCDKIGIGYLKFEGTSSKKRITYNKDPKVDCIYCGQCAANCPTGAAREQDCLEEISKILKDPKKIVLVQTAPSVRVSLGEEFGMEPGSNVEGKMYTVYRKLGFDKVFDTNFAADVTTIIEAEELVERLHECKKMGIGHPLPMFTSCCPGWVKFVEFYYPELIPNLTTANPPQIHAGFAYKTWWAEKEGVAPEDIIVVSIMPCTAKKYEANKEKFRFGNNIKAVDYVLTTRELAALIRHHNIDFPTLEEGTVDKYGKYGGAGAIYGASGGVMEAALRSGYNILTGKDLPGITLEAVRNTAGAFKTADIDIDGTILKVAVASTPREARKLIEEIRKNPNKYHYIEIMACPGGCIGGGGQPFFPSTKAIVEKRRGAIYDIDEAKTIRFAYKNPIAVEFIEWAKKQPKEKRDKCLYTSYSQKKKFE